VNDQPLAGRRILVTRAAQQAGKLSDALRALGAEPVEVPVLEIRPPASYDPLDHALRQLDQYEWLILTSANTVRVLAERASALQISTLQPPSLKVAAVGPATSAAAHEAGFQVTFVPESYVAESLIDGLTLNLKPQGGEASGPRNTPPSSRDPEGGGGFNPRIEPAQPSRALAPEGRILLARAAIARDVIPDALRAAVDIVDAYQNVLPGAAPDQLRQALAGGLDAATFTSSSSVIHLAEAAKLAGIEFPFAGVPAISIGPITSRTLRELGWPPAAEANPSDISGLVVAVLQVFND
jgi:uroporphyrinogen-III synthase